MEAIEVTFLTCPQCHGFGYVLTATGEQVICSHCHARFSTIGFTQNDLLYWNIPLTTQVIRQRHWQYQLDQALNFGLIIIGIAGIISIMIQGYALGQTVAIFDMFAERSINVLIFWYSLLTDLILYYRIELSAQQSHGIRNENKLRHFTIQGDVADWNYWQTVPNKLKVNVSNYYSVQTLRFIDEAFTLAKHQQHSNVYPIHVLLSLRQHRLIQELFYRLEIDHTRLETLLEHVLQRCQQETVAPKNLQATAELYQSLLYAYTAARIEGRRTVTAVELLMGCILADPIIQDVFNELKVDLTKIRNLVHWTHLVEDVRGGEQQRRKYAHGKPKTAMNRAMTARPTNQLDAISQDFTLMAKRNAFLPVIGREAEVEAAFRVLQEGQSSVLLVGESGSGKSTLLQGIANLMTAENVPKSLQDKRLVVTDPGAIIAGAGNIGGLEQRMQAIIHEIVQAGNVIWAIEDIHTLLGAGSTGSNIDLGKILMNYISQGYIKVIGTTTTPEFQKYIENQETFLRRFQVVRVPELLPQAAILVLEGHSTYLEYKYGVFFTYDAIEACVQLSDRFIQDRHLPAKALDIMEEAAIYAKDHATAPTKVTKQIVEIIMSQKTNISLTAVSSDEATKLLHLEDDLHQRVIGQEEAITAIARALRRARQDIRDAQRPIAALLFLGPTGVGKTETAKAIAAIYFGNEHNMIRLDMSEYDNPDTLNKLIGTAGQQGQLTEAVRKTPFAIVLLDELEKAHPAVLNVFLQVLDDGRLTDGTGRTINFTNTMIIATSNAGTDFIQQQYQLQRTSAQIKEDILQQGLLNNYFHTEFLNRFDHVAVFTPLSREQLFGVGELLLQHLAKQLIQRGITIQWTPDVVADLVQHGYDPKYGARPLRRYIQDTVEDGIAKLLLRNELSRRDIVQLQINGEVTVIKAKEL